MKACAHGHTTRSIGCVSCVLVFATRPPVPIATRCPSTSGRLTCDRHIGHGGHHRSYKDEIDQPVFWS